MTTAHSDIVFVYGALRSGTTVFRLMLDAHPKISNPGEMDFLFDHLTPDTSHPTGWRYDIEALRNNRVFKSKNLKIPETLTGLDLLENFFEQMKAAAPGQTLSINLHRHIDRVFAALPDVRVLHMLRDPRDVARSSIPMGWAGTLYHGVDHWIGTEQAWGRASTAADPSQIFEMTYEGLFRDTESTLQAVCDFFDVPFDPEMLRYHENTTYGPPDVSLTEQWKRKCTPQELRDVEYRAGVLLTERGYVPSQPRSEPGLLHKVRLSLQNKLYLWRFGMNRYGIVTYLGEKFTRWAGLKGPHRRFKLRMQHVLTQSLK